MSAPERESEVLSRVSQSLVAEGFDVIVEPRGFDLPDFLGALAPDAIAHRGDEHLVVEVVPRSIPSQAKLRLLRHALLGRPGWSLRTVWTSGREVKAPNVSSLSDVLASLKEVAELIEGNHFRPAFLMCWAIFESLGRVLMPAELKMPQTPSRIVEHIASAGLVSRDEASALRRMAQIRNRLIHGELHVFNSESTVRELADILMRVAKIAEDGGLPAFERGDDPSTDQ
jgi:uncharacterized protein YutE (UPF0331/DUF86 family)